MQKVGLAALVLALLVAVSPLAWLASAENDRSAEVLIQNAKRLQQFVHLRNSVISASINVTLFNETWSTILNLTVQADQYLDLAVQLYNSGNYTAAKELALKAMHLYSNVLELQSELAEELGLEFRFMGKLPMNLTAKVGNMTIAINKTALTLQLQVLEARVSQLRSQLSKLNTSVGEALELLDEAASLLEQAKSLLTSGNATVSDLARILAEVKRLLGLANAELNKAALHMTIVRAMKIGWLKRNETGYLNVSLINHTLAKLKSALRKGLLNESEIEQALNATAKLLKDLKERIKSAAEKVGKLEKRLEKLVETRKEEAGKPVPPVEPPGWAKKGQESGKPGKGPRK
uniref:Uncharacterized protein n=1 Tax=Thermofilum pendens TaxID=2269 RepID=A0A7C4BAA8_THEPE